MNILPTFEGYTVDERLRQFRKVSYDKKGNPSIAFVDFDSEKGKKLISKLNAETRERG